MQASFNHQISLFRILSCFGLLGVAAGCQPVAESREVVVAAGTHAPLTGQVFVVAPTGESLRLGSVQVRIFEAAIINAHMREKDDAIAGRKTKLQGQLAELESAARDQAEARARAEEAYNKRDGEIRGELASLTMQLKEKVAFLRGEIESNAAFIARKDTFPPPPQGVPLREEYEAYRKLRDKWLSMDREERDAWAAVLASLNRDLETKIEELTQAREEKVYAFADELQVLDEKILALAKSAAATATLTATVEEELQALEGYSQYLVEMPAPLAEVRTDAAGEFSVELPKGRSYVIFAEAERVLGGETVTFRWLVQSGETPGSRILLSNHNLVTSESPESVIPLSGTTGESNT